jgi:hypothetical protein
MPISAHMQKRVIMRIELYPEAKEKLADLCQRLGMTQVSATSRLVEWFTSQPDVVQAAVLGLYPRDIAADIATIILKKMAKDKK